MAQEEQALIRRCQRGETEAFEGLYRRHERSMLALAYRMMGNREEAEDVMQEAFLKVYRRIGQYRFDSAFSSWVYRIVANTCYDHMKRRKPAAHLALETAGEIGEEDRADLRVHLRLAIDRLPPKMKACFVLFSQEGFRQEEIAEMLGLRVGTVKAHVFRAREQLREALAPRLRGWDHDEMP